MDAVLKITGGEIDTQTQKVKKYMQESVFQAGIPKMMVLEWENQKCVEWTV